jgi:iron complex outermembrane receptor protein
LAVLALLSFAAADGRAQTPPPGGSVPHVSNIEDASLEGLLDLNLEDKLGKTEAVSRTSESVLRAPAAMTTIDATQIRLSGATTVADVLRTVPGVTVMRVTPGNYVVSLRGTGGLASNNVILLVDGIALNSPLDGTVSWDLIPVHLEDVERIEVVRGPVSPTYGANAYTGVINIVTRTTAAFTSSYAARLRGGMDTNGGNAGVVSGRYLHLGKQLQFKLFLNAEHDGTYIKPATTGPDASPLDQFGTSAELAFLPDATSRLSVEGGAVFSRHSGADHLALDPGANSRRLVFGRVLFELHPSNDTRAKVWAQGLSLAVGSPDQQPTTFSYVGARTFRTAAGTDLTLSLGPAFALLAGGQGAMEQVDASFVHPNVDGQLRPSYGFYAGVKAQPASSIDLVLTGRGDLSPISAKFEYSYRASAIYHADEWGLRVTGASAFRSPTYIEAAGRFIDPASGLILLEGSDTIGAPRNTSVEVGATFAPSEKLTFSPTIYYSRLSNLMIEDFDSVVRRTFENDPTTRTLVGGELEANWRVTEALAVMPSFSVLDFLDASERIDTNVGVPSQNARFVGGLRLQGLFGKDTWGYGVSGTLTSARSYNVRAGIPPTVLTKQLPASARLTGMLEHQLVQMPSIWASVRLGATLPSNTLESPLPSATPLGQSAVVGIEVRRE